MSNPPDDKNLVSLIAQEHIGPDSSGDNIGAKRVANYVWNGSTWERQSSTGGGGDASASNQTSGAQKTQIVDAGGEQATVTGGKLDVNASVDTTGLATSAIQTDKSQFTKLTDGTDTALITASGEQNVIATAQPGVDIGDVTVNNASGAAAVNIQDGGNSITVDGAVSVSGVSTATNQTDGSQKSQIVDAGGEAATVTGGKLDVNASVDTTGLALDATLTNGTQLLGSQTFTKKSVTASSSGNNTIHTPAAGKKIRLYFFGYSAGAGVTGVLAAMKFTTSGTVFDNQYLITAGQAYARNIQAGKRYVDGAVDEALIVNLSGAQTVYVSCELEEI